MLVEGMSAEPLLFLNATQVWDYRAGEVECTLLIVHYNLRRVRVFQCGDTVALGERFYEGGDVNIWRVEALFECLQL